jgi:hypothetical protein
MTRGSKAHLVFTLVLGAGAVTCFGLFGLRPAVADAASSPSSSSGSSSPSGSSSASSSPLGGYQTAATGSGITWTYEQPNFPVPATPTLEANLGYSTTTYNAGPVGESLASTLWPGQVAANAPGELSVLLQPYLGNSTPNLNVPPWPVQASTSYPPGPSTSSSASQNSPGVTMEANSTQQAGSASANFGSSSGGNSYALPSGFISVQSLASAVQSTVTNGEAVSQGTAQVHGVSIAGGLITIGQVTSTGTSTSDGNQAHVSGTSTASQVSVAGQAVDVTSSGIQAAGHNVVPLGSTLSSVQKAMSAAGISMVLTQPTDNVSGASGTRQLDGLQITINLTTLDKQAGQLVASLPQDLQQKVIDQLPLPPPDEQIMVVDLGWVNISAAASPGFDASSSASGASSSANPGSAGSPGSGATAGSPGSSFGGPGSNGTTAGVGGTTGSGRPGSNNGLSPAAVSAPPKLFEGIGAGLIALGVIVGLVLACVLWRADRAVGVLTAATVCMGEDPPISGGT